MASTDWDIASLSSEGSGSAKSAQSRRSIAWDNNSRASDSDLSNLTGDSFRSRHSNYSRSRAMFLSIGNSLLGEAESETSEKDPDDIDLTNDTIFAAYDVDGSFRFGEGNELATVAEEDAFTCPQDESLTHQACSLSFDTKKDGTTVPPAHFCSPDCAIDSGFLADKIESQVF